MEEPMKRVLFVCIAPLLFIFSCTSYPDKNPLDGVMPGSDGKIDVITIFSHPDDETFYVGGTLIKLKKDPRVRLHIVCLTNGNADEAKDNLGITRNDLARFRTQELKLAATVLGADEVTMLGYDDQGLVPADQTILQKKINAAVAASHAQLIITHDPFGLSGHPDHVICSRAATEAFNMPGVQKLLYVTMPPGRYWFNLLFSLDSPKVEQSLPDFSVNIKQEKKLKALALYSHATQYNFSFWNGLAVYEDLFYNTEHFKVAGDKNRK